MFYIHLKWFFYRAKLNLFDNFSLLLDINFDLKYILELKKYVPEDLIERIYSDLSNKLDSKYHYHNLHHTKEL